MDVASIHSTHSPNPPYSHELMLQESIDHFLSELHKSQPDFSGLSSIFARLVQTMHDPPLEMIWFYSAVTFRGSGCVTEDPLARVSVIKDLFQLLVSCSASCNGVKRVAVLAPVIYKLWELVNGENFLWAKTEIDCFIEGIASYISMCCCKDLESDDGSVHLTQCFVDLARVWTVDRGAETWNFGEDLRVFFPLVSNEARQGIGVGCGGGYLAGVVMCEAFLLRLCLKFGSSGSRVELQKEMLNWAVNSINGFRNWHFFDIILRTLLDPVLPVTSLLSPEDEILTRKVLYDAVIMVEYSFLDPESGIQLPANHLKNLALTWLFVAGDGICFLRKHGDQTKVVSYIDAFTESRLPSQLIEWVTNQTGIEQKIRRPKFSTPCDLIRWLLILQDEGIRLFDHISKFHAKAVIYKSRVDHELSVFKPDSKSLDDNLFICIDNKGRQEVEVDMDQTMVSSADAVFFTAAHTANSTGTSARRKRKEGGWVEGETHAKFVKYHFDETSMGEKFLSSGDEDGLSSGTEVENFVSDEDMEDMEQ